MILGRGQPYRLFAIQQRKGRKFWPADPFLDENLGTGSAEPPTQHLVNTGIGLLGCIANCHPLASGQTIGFHHTTPGQAGGKGLGLIRVGEIGPLRLRNMVLATEITGKTL